MLTIYKLFVAIGITSLAMFVLNRYLARQATLGWLGLSHGASGWKKLQGQLESKFSYRNKDIEENFIQAGFYNTRFARFYFPAKLLLVALLETGLFLFGTRLGIEEFLHQLITGLLILIVVIIVPDIWLQLRRQRRIRKISAQMPYTIDLMAVCIQTGLTIETSIAYLGEELKTFDRDLAFILRQLDARARVVGMSQALEELLDQYPSQEMRSFVYTLSQSLQYGSSIFDVLSTLSANIREVQMLELEERVGKLSAKMSVPLILFVMFPIVILITAPGILRLMSDG